MQFAHLWQSGCHAHWHVVMCSMLLGCGRLPGMLDAADRSCNILQRCGGHRQREGGSAVWAGGAGQRHPGRGAQRLPLHHPGARAPRHRCSHHPVKNFTHAQLSQRVSAGHVPVHSTDTSNRWQQIGELSAKSSSGTSDALGTVQRGQEAQTSKQAWCSQCPRAPDSCSRR